MPLIASAARSSNVVMLGAVLLLFGCATVRIEAAGQEVRVEHYWGILAVQVGDPGTSHVAELTALGLARSPFGWSAGFTRQRWAAQGSECRLVIWADAAEHLQIARQLADSANGICVNAFSTEAKTEVHANETAN